MHLLPLDRRTIFSRNVFCGATSPLLPPAMVILPTARGLGASRRGSSGQQQAGRGARAQSRLEVPHAPHGDPGGQGRRLPPAATLAPSSRLPPCGRPRSALARARLAAAACGWEGGAAAPGPAAPPTGRVPRAGLRETEPWSSGRRETASGGGAGGGSATFWANGVRDAPGALSWWTHTQQGHRESWDGRMERFLCSVSGGSLWDF